MNQQPIKFKIDKVSFELQDQHDFTFNLWVPFFVCLISKINHWCSPETDLGKVWGKV